MGLFGKYIGSTKNDVKVAKYEYKKAKLESKERKKEAARNEKEGQIKSIQEGAQLSLNYAKNNYESMCERVNSLYARTAELIDTINNLKTRKLSKEEEKELAKANEEVSENLDNLYLIKDYFIFVTRLANGMSLNNEQLLLIAKFGAFFDGVDVLYVEDNEEDDDYSLLGDIKEMGRDFIELFVSPKKKLSDFRLRDYVEDKYSDEIYDMKLPELETVLDSFEKLTNKEKPHEHRVSEQQHQESVKTVECPKCHSTLPETAKFCPNCGTKMEPQGQAFCIECGNPLRPGTKFCPNCGAEVNK